MALPIYIAGQDIANPSGLLLSAVMMLVHIGQGAVAERIHNAWLRTIEDGCLTADLRGRSHRPPLGTQDFALAVIQRLGQQPVNLSPVHYPPHAPRLTTPKVTATRRPPAAKRIVGVDVFVHASDCTPDQLAARLKALTAATAGDAVSLHLQMITNRGVKVWPGGFDETFCTDHWRCRFLGRQADGSPVPIGHAAIVGLMGRLAEAGLDFIKTEHLCEIGRAHV